MVLYATTHRPAGPMAILTCRAEAPPTGAGGPAMHRRPAVTRRRSSSARTAHDGRVALLSHLTRGLPGAVACAAPGNAVGWGLSAIAESAELLFRLVTNATQASPSAEDPAVGLWLSSDRSR